MAASKASRSDCSRFRTTLRRLEVLVAVVEEGGFRACSDRLGISEAAVSHHILQLEQELGCCLFQRRRGSVPGTTSLGITAYREAKELLEHANSLFNLGKLGSKAAVRTIEVWASPILDGFLARPVADFLEENKGINIVLRERSFEDIVNALNNDHCDVGYFFAAGPLSEVLSDLAWREPVSICGGVPHEALGLRRITTETLLRYPFVAPQAGTHFRRTVDELFRRSGIVGYSIALEANHATVARAAVASGRVLSGMVSRCLSEGSPQQGLQALDLAEPLCLLEARRSVRPALRHDPLLRRLTSYLDAEASPGF